MRAVTLDYSGRRLIAAETREPPSPSADEALFEIAAVGVCGTDRDLARFRIGAPPDGEQKLILGHEALGQIKATGAAAGGFAVGDWVVPMVRRPCSSGCSSCARGRRDLCLSGTYTERGIMGAHGYFCDYAIDKAADLIPVPAALVDVAILTEPLSVVEKAASLALRLHQGEPARATVLGAGAIGLLAALVLRQRGLEVTICSAEPAQSARATLVRDAGFAYSDASRAADVVIEATGSAEAAAAGLSILGPLGVMIVLGAPNSRGELPFRDLILGNRIVAGSVNAGPADWEAAVADLGRFDRVLLDRMLYRTGFDSYRESILGPPVERPKTVHMLR